MSRPAIVSISSPLAVALALALALLVTGCRGAPNDAATAPGTGVVVEVIDGDTIDVRLGGRVERVRLLGIDTPETVDPDRPVGCHGPEASALAHELLPEGTAVRLERDIEARDVYDRLLAYVFRLDDDLFVNEALLAAGEAEVLAIEPNAAYRDRLAAAAGAARAADAGLWGACQPDRASGS